MKLSIIIVNYKTKGLLKQCLRGGLDAGLPFATEFIVVDNASHDGSVEMLRSEFPNVTCVASEVNTGFGAGANLGFKVSKGEYVMVLNPDIAIFRGAIERMVQWLDQHPAVGLVGPRLINPDGTVQQSCYRFPSFWIPVLRRTPLGRFPNGRELLRAYLMSDWDHNNNREVGWILGACLLLRRSLAEKIGLFDERFFLYFEDVDFCRRVWQSGLSVYYLAEAELVHYHQRLSAENPGIAGLFSYPTRVHISSWMKYMAKYFGSPKPPYSL